MTWRHFTKLQACHEWFGKGDTGLDGGPPLKDMEDKWQNNTGPNYRHGDRKFYHERKNLFDEVERRMEQPPVAQGGVSQEERRWSFIRAMEAERLSTLNSKGKPISVKEYQSLVKQQPALQAWRANHPAKKK